jgi:DNA-directed RNA polymerase specialized sigma24 family protein
MSDERQAMVTKEELQAAMRARKVAGERYKQLITLAKAEGWSNSEIARAVGVSEAAIRLYFARNPESCAHVYTTELVS